MRLPASLRETLRSWTWRHSALGVALGLLNVVFGPAGGLVLWPSPFGEKDYVTASLFHVLLFGLPIVAAVRWADHAVDAGAAAGPAYTLAVTGVAVAGSWLGWALGISVWGGQPANQVRNAWLAVGIATLYGLGVAIYVHGRRARLALAAVHRGEAERARQAQQLQLQRLQALQARVEPQLLFDTLGHVQAQALRDAAAADAELALLIALLRAQLPRVGDTGSTLAREFELLRAHAALHRLPEPRLDADGPAADTPIAPMLLLPLLRLWQAHAASGQACALRAQRQGGQLRVDLAPQDGRAAAAPPAEPELQPLRERLASVYGTAAQLRAGAGPAFTLSVPPAP